VLREATEAFHAALAEYTLADLVRQPRALCDILHLARTAP